MKLITTATEIICSRCSIYGVDYVCANPEGAEQMEEHKLRHIAITASILEA